jgi:uncharacterized Zn-finger protein
MSTEPTLEEIIYYHAPHHLPPVQPTSLLLPPTSYNSHNSTLAPVQSLQPAVAVSAPLPFAHQAVADYPPLPPVLAAAAIAANDLVQSHTCEVCSKSFLEKSMLKRHKLIHSEEKPLKCDQEGCEYSCTRQDTLKIHIQRKHTKKLPAASTSADFSTVVSASLPPDAPLDELSATQPEVAVSAPLPVQPVVQAPHHLPPVLQSEVAVSAPLPPILAAATTAANDLVKSNTYTCEVCSRSFKFKSKFIRHKRIHTGERPYVCKTCGYSFTQSHHLKRHEEKHTGEKPFVCEICGYSFTQNGNLIRHIERKHSEKLPAASTPADFSTVVSAPLPPNVSFDELPAAQPEVAVSAPLPPTLSFTNGADQVSDDNDDDIDE